MLESKLTRKEELIYLAGFFDGEGCICLSKRSYPKSKGYTFRVICTCVNANPKPIFRLQQLFGGSKVSKRWPNKGTMFAYYWQIEAHKAFLFLKTLLPYLIVKKEEAELAILFQEARKNLGRRKTMEELAVEEAQHMLMKNLKRGEVKTDGVRNLEQVS